MALCWFQKVPLNREIRTFGGATFGISISKNKIYNSGENDKDDLDLEDPDLRFLSRKERREEKKRA